MGDFNLLDEIYFTGSDKYKSIQSLLSKGLIRKIAPEIYTSNFEANPSDIIRRNLFQIIAEKFPGSVISHRSAFELAPFQDNIFVTSKYTDKYLLPGVTVNLLKGVGPITGDGYMFGAAFSQRERALLENMQISKGKPSKSLSREQIEEKLELYLRTHGEEYLNQIRDKSRLIAHQLSMTNEFSKLDSVIGAMMGTKSIKKLKSDVGKARFNRIPFDINRMHLFEKLFFDLQNKMFKRVPDANDNLKSYKLFGFFESYFSNFIEGTKFQVEDAKQIVDSGLPMPSRVNDSHDVLGTYKIVSDKKALSVIPNNADDFIDLLKYRHKILLNARPEFSPGMFKEKVNVAGNTVFVEPELVIGTLKKGFEYYNALQEPFARAAYMMFLIAETHPFNDGNGRIARIFMNSELTRDNQSKIIIITSFRDDYILALKKLTNQHDTEVYIRMLEKAHNLSSRINGENFNQVYDFLKGINAFEEANSNTILIPEIKRDDNLKNQDFENKL
jgi:prophage maintenance system killer protein